ncbi:MAG: hypothetical protein QOH65_1000 [Methylobacteriaceae bacterium]|nr:hypothetical protein [Methylobacteriaceae bacterium]
MPISFESGALRLKPSLRVRFHGRDRLPELAVTMSLAAIAVLFGASLFTPTSGTGDRFRSDVGQAQVIEVRSAATNEISVPVRKDVRVIPLDRTPAGGDASG